MAKQSLLTRIKANARNRDSNANATLQLMGEAIDNYAGTGEYVGRGGDWTNLAWIIALAQGSDAKRLRDILEAATGVTFKVDAKQPTGLRIANAGDNETNNIALFAEYVSRGYSFRSSVFETGIEGELAALLMPREKKARTVEEIILAAVRKVKADCGEAATKVRIQQALAEALKAEF